MQYYAVIDTNVLVSAMLKFQSVPGQIANEALLRAKLVGPTIKKLLIFLK